MCQWRKNAEGREQFRGQSLQRHVISIQGIPDIVNEVSARNDALKANLGFRNIFIIFFILMKRGESDGGYLCIHDDPEASEGFVHHFFLDGCPAPEEQTNRLKNDIRDSDKSKNESKKRKENEIRSADKKRIQQFQNISKSFQKFFDLNRKEREEAKENRKRRKVKRCEYLFNESLEKIPCSTLVPLAFLNLLIQLIGAMEGKETKRISKRKEKMNTQDQTTIQTRKANKKKKGKPVFNSTLSDLIDSRLRFFLFNKITYW